MFFSKFVCEIKNNMCRENPYKATIKHILPFGIAVSAVFTAILLCRCGRQDVGQNKNPKTIEAAYRQYIEHGMFDSILIVASSVFDNPQEYRNDRFVAKSGIQAAQAAIFLGDYDKAGYYIRRLDSLGCTRKFEDLDAILDGVKGSFYIKVDFNYGKAVTHLVKALNHFKQEGDVFNSCTVLSNMAMIYFFRRDTTGFEKYALQTVEMCRTRPEDTYLSCLDNLFMSMLSMFRGDYVKADELASAAKETAEKYRYDVLATKTYMVLGTVAMHYGNMQSAEDYFVTGMERSEENDNDYFYEFAVPYARLMVTNGQYDKAKEFITDMLERIHKMHSTRYEYQMLDIMSELYMAERDTALSYVYYRQSVESRDALLGVAKETEFNEMLNLYEKTAMEMTIQKKNHQILIVSVILLISMAVGLFVYLRYIQQLRLYRKLVDMRQEYMARYELQRKYISPEDNGSEKKPDYDLFRRIESAMQKDRIYRKNNLSIDTLAAELCSNRTYISRAINGHAGKTFNEYVNMYRIDEATDILSNPEDDVLLKNLYENVGFNSATTFFRVFKAEVGCTPSQYREQIMRKTVK